MNDELLAFIHARLDNDAKTADRLPGNPNFVHRLEGALRKLVESRPAVHNPEAFAEVDRQREWTWKCIASIWADHHDYREAWRP